MSVHLGEGDSFPPASAVGTSCSWHAGLAAFSCIRQITRASPVLREVISIVFTGSWVGMSVLR